MSEENKKEEEVLLTPSEVWSVLEFAQAFGMGQYGYNNILTPDLVSARMRDVNLNPVAGTQDAIERALADPKDSEIELQEFSQNFELASQSYKRLISYCANQLSFDLNYTCVNAEKEDYTSPKYKKDFLAVRSFFDRFDYKKEFNIAVKEMLRNEAFMFIPRMDGAKIVLQELPASPTYTKITGRWDFGLLISLNLYWLILPGVSIDFYPPFFKRKYNELWNNGSIGQKYMPAINPELRGVSSYIFWQDLDPDNGGCFKLSPELATRIPYFSGMFLDLLNQGLMRNLQKNINMSTANRLIMGEIPMLKDTVAKVKDQFSISASNLGQFLALVKAAIGDSLKTTAVPLTNVQGIQFPAINDLYSSYLTTTLATAGINTDLIFSGAQPRPNIMATQLSLNVDEQLMMTLYPQMSSFLEYHVNKLTKHFKFKFTFQGTQFFNNRQQRFDRAMQLADRGIVLPQQISASMGLDPFDFQRQLEEAQGTDWTSKLTPIVSAFQQSSKDAGAPKKSDSEISDEGESTRSSGGNIGRGGKSE